MDDSSKHDQSNKEFMKAEILSPTVSEQQPQDTPSPAVHSQPRSTKSENDSFCFSCMSSSQKEDVDMKSQGHDYKTQILEYCKSIKDGSGYRYGVNSLLGYLMKFDGNYNRGSWSKIAELLVATKDNSILKSCLGYAASVLNDWMTVQHGDDSQGSDDVSELFMLAFLEALEKLPSDDQTFNACSIKQIVKELCAHRNVDIQRKARCVLEVWKSLGVQSIKSDKCEGASLQAHIEKCGTFVDSSRLGSSKDNTLLAEDKLAKVVGQEIIHGTTGDGCSNRGYTESSLSNSSCPEAEVCQTSLKDATKVYIPTCFIAETGDKKITVEERAESLESSDPCSVKLNLPPSCNTVEEKSVEHFDKQLSIAGPSSVTTSMVSSLNSSVSEAQPNCNSIKVVDNSSRLVSGLREPVSSSVIFESDERACSGEETSGTSSSLGNHEGTGPSVGDLKFRSHFKHSASMYNTNELCGRLDDSYNTEKQSFSNHSKSEEESRGGDIDLGYVEDDALEVARQVAKEVEMEVESSLSSEKHAGSEQMQSGTTYSAGQKQNVFLSNECNEKEESQEHASVVPLLTPDGTISEVQDTKDSLVQQNSEQVVTKLRETAQESESCKMTMTSQESITVESSAKMSNAVENKEGRRCVFDLNEDIRTEGGGEDLHQLTHGPAAVSIASNCTIGTVSAPIHVVAVSKSFDISISPLHFEGELGWRGSAVTSAFRPARRASDAAPSNEEISPIKTENTAFEFDLNAPCDDGSGSGSGSGNIDISIKENCGERPVPASAGIASCDSSIEVSSSRRAERLTWDLNRVDESVDSDPVALCGWRNFDRLGKQQKLDFCSSPTSSCRPAAQVFDLNEDPPTEDVSTSTYGNTHIDYHKNAHSDNFVFSLMGSKINIAVTKLPSAQPKTDKDGVGLPLGHPNLAATWNNSYGIGEREFPNSAQPFFVSGPTVVSSFSANMGRTFPVSSALTFSTSTLAIPYNGLAFGASYHHHINPCSASAPLPCMIDTVGTTVSPHLIPSVHVSPAFARLPFSADSTTNRASLDLNTGSSAFESECNDIGGTSKNMFPSSNHILPEEQLRTFHQPTSTSSRLPLRRKEPDAPWDSYRLDHNHHSSYWR